MEWLIEGLREPLAELAELLVLAVLTVVTARIRGRQKAAHEGLRRSGVLPPLADGNRPCESSSNTPPRRRSDPSKGRRASGPLPGNRGRPEPPGSDPRLL